MTSLSWNQLCESFPKRLYIPQGIEKMSTCDAARAYAEAGFNVLPVNPKSKTPSLMLGTGWPDKSTRDLETIKSYFRNPETAIGIHVGKSGALVFDVDEPNNLPPLLLRELSKEEVTFQSTRLVGDNRRGHYIFQVEDGSQYGNSLGNLGGGWGDIRGCNGIIVVSPSTHMHEYGYYKWQRTGTLPMLPATLEYLLPKRLGGSVSSANPAEAQAFVNKYVGNLYPALFRNKIGYLKDNPPLKNNRHFRFQGFLVGVLSDASVGFYPASMAISETLKLFNILKPIHEQNFREFEGMVLWAISQAEAKTVEEKAMHAYQNAPHLDEEIMKWVRSHGN